MASIMAITPHTNSTMSRLPAKLTNPDFISPSTRRVASFDGSPSVSNTSTFLDIGTENDDEAEKKERRRSRVLELQRKAIASPASAPERKQLDPLTGMSNVQLTEHYTNCIKLSAENKINAKNAFSLHLIDYMSDLIKKKEMNNFQVASSTLDASAKIYAGRVDSIHSQTYKLLTGLGRPADKNDKEGDEPAAMEDEEHEGNRTQKKVRKKKSSTIAKNLNTINKKGSNEEYEVDPLFQKTSASFDEGGTGGLLMCRLRCLDDTSKLVFDSEAIAFGNDKHESSEKSLSLRGLGENYLNINFEPLQLCPAFCDFSFLNWKRVHDDSFQKNLSQRSSILDPDQRFDLDIEAEPIIDSQDDHHESGDAFQLPSADDIGIPDVGCEDDIDNDVIDDHATIIGDDKEAQMVETALSNIHSGDLGILMQVLSAQPNEYSYFSTNLLRTWAGPVHWKLQNVNKISKDKSKKPRLKKERFKIEYLDMDLDSHFKETRKSTTLTKKTIDAYSNSQTTLPEDMRYAADILFRLFLKKKVMVRRQNPSNAETESTVDDNIDNYDYDNENDRENFCPDLEEGRDDDDDDHVGFDFNLTAGTQQDMFGRLSSQPNDYSVLNGSIIGSDSLIAQPKKVNKIDIAYAKTAKKMDVKRLKAAMWHVLTKPQEITEGSCKENDENKENLENETTKSHNDTTLSSVDGKHNFTELINILPNLLSKSMSNNLSIPIAFVCLLHLANEKTLKITGLDDMSDLVITQD